MQFGFDESTMLDNQEYFVFNSSSQSNAPQPQLVIGFLVLVVLALLQLQALVSYVLPVAAGAPPELPSLLLQRCKACGAPPAMLLL